MVTPVQSSSILDFSGSHERRQERRTGFLAVSRWALGACLFGLVVLSFVGCRQKKAESSSREAKPQIVSSPKVKAQIEASPETNEPKATQTPMKFSDIKANEIIDRTVPIVDENGVTFVPAQLHKNATLLVLAFEPDIRADFVVMTARHILTPEQIVLAKQLALSYEDQFQVLKRRRSAILETATDENDVDRRLLKVDMELALLQRQIRWRINTDIMTQEQRVESNRLHLEQMAETAAKEEADAKTKAASEKARTKQAETAIPAEK